jgi:hypothetical protein
LEQKISFIFKSVRKKKKEKQLMKEEVNSSTLKQGIQRRWKEVMGKG